GRAVTQGPPAHGGRPPGQRGNLRPVAHGRSQASGKGRFSFTVNHLASDRSRGKKIVEHPANGRLLERLATKNVKVHVAVRVVGVEHDRASLDQLYPRQAGLNSTAETSHDGRPVPDHVDVV